MTTTELSFLIELLLEHELKADTKKLIAKRIRDVEVSLSGVGSHGLVSPISNGHGIDPRIAKQALSTQAILARNPDLAAAIPPPVAVVAQTPATAAALEARNASIAAAISGKVEKGRTAPRKF